MMDVVVGKNMQDALTDDVGARRHGHSCRLRRCNDFGDGGFGTSLNEFV
jgi:hypothetical protein